MQENQQEQDKTEPNYSHVSETNGVETNDELSANGKLLLVNDLTDKLLQRIFALVEFQERVQILPFVCSRWNKLLQTPSVAWETVQIDQHEAHGGFASLAPDRLPNLDVKSLTAWFQRRGNAVRKLELSGCIGEGNWEHFVSCVFPFLASSVESVSLFNLNTPNGLCMLAELKRVKYLRYFGADHLSWSDDDIEQLAKLTDLEVLQLLWSEDMEFPLPILTLTKLQKLELHATLTFPDGLSRLQNLNDLDLWDASQSVFPEVVTCLTKLERLRVEWLKGCPWKDGCLLPSGLSHLKKLANLSLNPKSMLLDTHHLGSLTSLTRLHLDYCKLTSIPTGLRSLTSLVLLILDFNSISEVPDWITDLTSLQLLNLLDQDLDPSSEFSLPLCITTMQQLKSIFVTSYIAEEGGGEDQGDGDGPQDSDENGGIDVDPENNDDNEDEVQLHQAAILHGINAGPQLQLNAEGVVILNMAGMNVNAPELGAANIAVPVNNPGDEDVAIPVNNPGMEDVAVAVNDPGVPVGDHEDGHDAPNANDDSSNAPSVLTHGDTVLRFKLDPCESIRLIVHWQLLDPWEQEMLLCNCCIMGQSADWLMDKMPVIQELMQFLERRVNHGVAKV